MGLNHLPNTRAQVLSPENLAASASVALYRELALYPKPGLVSFRDNGSHRDMTAHTFLRSIHALRPYFADMVTLGAQLATFRTLQDRGIQAEVDMLKATGGINTHRGAIFMLGLLCASAGLLQARAMRLSAENLRDCLQMAWGDELEQKSRQVRNTRGYLLGRQHGLRSAAEEAARGFPCIFEVGLPALRAAQQYHLHPDEQQRRLFLALLSHIDDTNLVNRGGMAGLQFAREAACMALQDLQPGASVEPVLAVLHTAFVQRNLSPGGCADALAATLWVDTVCGAQP
ncbi:triphosphoribosyl-dephospho-CoA synthase [Limnobacter humi]|uniref:triphosphoribosyl-dephospho-CoA synthase n=1 Tax=Limnobacter humi TaxID=1778671 RepID=A0ABT1WDT9_9BURK|nr:triphosphoribosyl-dephospho-CoA synthase [Limnobacter humi]MCQ8895206.1 triphosphoribosyl-dephospho-CoA synthase [Limnobacter humi]